MDAVSEMMGLMFATVARARREAVRQELMIHGFEDLEETALPFLLDGTAEGATAEETERLLRVCRVVDGRMLAGLEAEEREILCAYLRRMLRNLRGDGGLFT